MADEARLNELLDLVEQARAEGDTATEQKATDAYKRESAPQQPFPDVYGGAGGYNPMLSGVAGLVQRGGESLGMTPENTANPVANAVGPAETAMQLGTGALAFPAAGMAGIGQGVKNLFSPGMSAADRVRQIQEALTYQPRTGAGQGMSAAASAIPQAYEKGTNYLGEKTTDVTGSPAAGAFVKTLGDIAPSVIGARALPKGGPRPTGEYKAGAKYDVPTTEQLKSAADENYSAAENSGVVIKPDSTRAVVDMMQRVADKENLGKLPPKLNEAASVLKDRAEAGKPLTLMEADKVRQLIGDAMKSTDPADRRLAKIIQGDYDKYLNGLGRADTISGDASLANAYLSAARKNYKRQKNAELADKLYRKAEKSAEANFTQSGIEHTLRMEYKKLSNNEKAMRMLTPEQRAAVEKVAAPGALANTMRFVGKFDPTSGPIPAALSFATGGALPLLGFAGRRAATAITKGNVAKAREALVGRGAPEAPYPMQRPKPAASPVDALPFTLTPGVLPAKVGPLSRGIEFEPSPVPNAQQLPNFLGRPGDLTAETPPPMMGGIPYRPARNASLAGDLSLEGPTPKYPGGVDFTPSALPPQIPRDLALALVSEKTRATAATAQKGLLDLPRVTRSRKDLQAQIRLLETRTKSLSPEQLADSSYMRALSQEWARLQAELEAIDNRAIRP